MRTVGAHFQRSILGCAKTQAGALLWPGLELNRPVGPKGRGSVNRQPSAVGCYEFGKDLTSASAQARAEVRAGLADALPLTRSTRIWRNVAEAELWGELGSRGGAEGAEERCLTQRREGAESKNY